MDHFVCSHCYRILKAIFHPGEHPVKRTCAGELYCCRCGNLAMTPVLYQHVDENRFPCEGTHPYVPYVEWSAQVRDQYQREVRGRR